DVFRTQGGRETAVRAGARGRGSGTRSSRGERRRGPADVLPAARRRNLRQVLEGNLPADARARSRDAARLRGAPARLAPGARRPLFPRRVRRTGRADGGGEGKSRRAGAVLEA